MHQFLPMPVHIKVNPDRWPPMHTPIVRQKYIPDRAAVMMDRMRGGMQPPCPPVFSLVTGDLSYDDFHARDILRDWSDHPQRLWDAVYATLAGGIGTVIHVGPAPNVIPATFNRLGDNIRQQTAGRSLGKMGMCAAAGLAGGPGFRPCYPAGRRPFTSAKLRSTSFWKTGCWSIRAGEASGDYTSVCHCLTAIAAKCIRYYSG